MDFWTTTTRLALIANIAGGLHERASALDAAQLDGIYLMIYKLTSSSRELLESERANIEEQYHLATGHPLPTRIDIDEAGNKK